MFQIVLLCSQISLKFMFKLKYFLILNNLKLFLTFERITGLMNLQLYFPDFIVIIFIVSTINNFNSAFEFSIP